MADSSRSSTEDLVLPDTKRRKMESEPDRAKINYWCAQLRIRLQYAKLKVEHGWQRQTLNEVENLYFRHVQKARPTPRPSARRHHQQQQQQQRVTFHTISNASPNGSSSIFPVAIHQFDAPPTPSPLGNVVTTSTIEAGPSSAPLDPLYADPALKRITSSSKNTNSATPLVDEQIAVRSTQHTPSFLTPPPGPSTTQESQDSTSTQVFSQLSTTSQSGFPEFPANSAFTFSVSTSPRPAQSQSQSQDPLSPSRDLSQPMLSQASTASTSAPPSNQISVALESLSASGLTYDSFWSTHSSYHTGGFGLAAPIPLVSQPVGQSAQGVVAGMQFQ